MSGNKCQEFMNKCKGYCCRNFTVDLKGFNNLQIDTEDARWFDYHNIKFDFKNKLAIVPVDCCSYNENTRTCSIYDNRPRACREFNCKLLGGDDYVLLE